MCFTFLLVLYLFNNTLLLNSVSSVAYSRPGQLLCLGGRSHRRHTVVVSCMYVSIIRLSVCRQDFSSLAENEAVKQATQAKVDICSKMNWKNFGYKALFVSYGVICLPWWLFSAIWTLLKTKLSTAGCLTDSEFVCTTKQRGRSREKLLKAYSSC